ncbi:MAG TPA: hypothetical protein VFA26_13255, partial [Gemmataceae bacterium]|nr:hypothetical protein [Gemmataceae bacterium]
MALASPAFGRRRAWPRRAAALLVALAVVATGSAALSPAQQADSPKLKVEDIRRVVLPKDRLAAELARAKQGVWEQMPRAEFEDLVRRAARAAEAAPAPRLVKAQYRARLENGGLAGSATWQVINPGPGAALLPVQ